MVLGEEQVGMQVCWRLDWRTWPGSCQSRTQVHASRGAWFCDGEGGRGVAPNKCKAAMGKGERVGKESAHRLEVGPRAQGVQQVARGGKPNDIISLKLCSRQIRGQARPVRMPSL